MQLLIISGFLGSGKTSILMPLVKQLTENGMKIAIIENEVGKTGVDDIYLKEHGLNVKEIFSGCICCTLRLDLIRTLLSLENEYDPDLVILEPSGVAGPSQILNALQGYGGDIDSKSLLSIIDAERFSKLATMNLPIITDGIKNADLVVVNKIDLVNDEQLVSLNNKLLEFNKDADIINISILNNTNVDAFFQLIQNLLIHTNNQNLSQILNIKEKNGDAPQIYSTEFSLDFNEIGLNEKEIKNIYAKKIEAIAKKLKKASATLIGNLKLIIKSDKGGYLLISTTSFERKPEIVGKLPSKYSKLTFNLNAMIYGITKEQLKNKIDLEFPK
jgi:G3E family GTPase